MALINYDKTYIPQGSVVKYSTYSAGNFGSVIFPSYRYGVSNPNWKKQIADKQDATTDYEAFYSECLNPWIRVIATYNLAGDTALGKSGWGGSPYYALTPVTSETIAADDIALKRLKRKLSTYEGDFKALIPLGELKETVGMYKGLQKTTLNTLQTLVDLKHRIKNPKKLFQYAADTWLQFNFGVSPLIRDINDGIDSVYSYINAVDRIVDQHGQKTIEWVSAIPKGNYGAAANHHWLGQGVHRHTYRVRYTAGVRYRVSSANGAFTHFGVTPYELVPALWELTAFSWVFDYFTTFGDFLEDHFSSESGQTVYACKSSKYVRESSMNWTLEKEYPYNNIYVHRCNNLGQTVVGTTKSTHFVRTKLASIPHRSFRIKTYDEVARFGTTKLLNLAAILAK